MLPNRLSLLLTAYIDGELSARRRQAVERLLNQSAEARALLQQLQEDANGLRQLPRLRLEPNFPGKVLRTIADRRLYHARRAARTRPATFPAWISLAAAASVLVLVGIGSFLYFDAAQRWHQDRQANIKKDTEAQAQPEKPPETEPAIPPKKDNGPEKAPSPAQVAQPEDLTPKPSPKVAHETPPKALRPSVELGAPTSKPSDLEVVPPGIGLSLALRELDQEEPKQRLRQELAKAGAFRLELFCLGNGKAFERMQTAFQAHGVRLLIDPEAQARLKNHRLKTDYALYTEGLTAGELAAILEQLGRNDKQAEARRRGDGQFDRLLVLPLTADDRKELARLLGSDPLQAPPPRPKTPLGVDIHKPVSQGTAAQVVRNLEGQGTPRPQPGQPATVKPPERLALVMAANPSRPRAGHSKEIKQFLDSRKERTPGAVRLFLVVHGVNG